MEPPPFSRRGQGRERIRLVQGLAQLGHLKVPLEVAVDFHEIQGHEGLSSFLVIFLY
jgi:hypothetical protein